MTNKKAAIVLLHIIEDYNSKPTPDSRLYTEIYQEQQIEALAIAARVLINTIEEDDDND